MYRRRRGVSRFAVSRRRRRLGLRSRRRSFRRFGRYRRPVRRRTGKRSFASRRRSFKRHTLRRRSSSRRRITQQTPHVFPKVNKSFRDKIYDTLQDVQTFCREVYNKIPSPLNIANFGQPCWWAIPYDITGMAATDMISTAVTFYPMRRDELATIYARVMDPRSGGGTWPVNPFIAEQTTIQTFAGLSSDPGAAKTLWPLNQLRLRLGMFYTYEIENTCNIPVIVRAYKIAARRHLDVDTFGFNILGEYIGQLWNSGIGTDTAGTLNESTMVNQFHSADYDLFSAKTMLSYWKVLKVKTFRLNPTKSRRFSCRVKARTWLMRDWFNDFPTAPPASTSCPWVRFKGVPEYVFRIESDVSGSATGDNLWPNAVLPDYSIPVQDMPAAVNLKFNMKYFCKPVIPQYCASTFNLGNVGQGATTTTGVAIVDEDFKSDVVHAQ